MPELHSSESGEIITGWGWWMTSVEDMVASGRNQDVELIFPSEQRRVLVCSLKLSKCDAGWILYFIVWRGSRLVQGFQLVSQSKQIQLVKNQDWVINRPQTFRKRSFSPEDRKLT